MAIGETRTLSDAPPLAPARAPQNSGAARTTSGHPEVTA